MRSEKDIMNLANSITNKEIIIKEINRTGEKYLAVYNYQFDDNLSEILKKGNKRIMESTKKYYQFLRDRAIELGINVSKHPETLEELTN